MKIKRLIFILFLLIAAGGGLAIILIRENNQPVAENQRREEAIKDKPIPEATVEINNVVQPEKVARPEAVNKLAKGIIGVEVIINEAKHKTAVKSDSSVYDLMSALKEQNKVDFKSYNYSGLGFFITEINGIKNDSAGKNWLYYVNGKLAPIGVSYYKLKNNDTIEWKYEKKSF